MQHATIIRVWEPSDHPRKQWPVTASVPFAEGSLREARQVVLRDPRNEEVPAQRRPLASWPDGSIKWLLLDFALDLAPRERVDVGVQIAAEAVAAEAREGIRVDRVGDELQVDTGALQFSLGAESGGLVRRLSAKVRVSSSLNQSLPWAAMLSTGDMNEPAPPTSRST